MVLSLSATGKIIIDDVKNANNSSDDERQPTKQLNHHKHLPIIFYMIT